MTDFASENDRLTTLLRALAAPEPPAGFVERSQRRYIEAREARYRRRVFLGLTAVGLCFVGVTALITMAVGPLTLVSWFATAVAEYVRWSLVIAIVLAQVPPFLWVMALLGATVSLLPVMALARTRPRWTS